MGRVMGSDGKNVWLGGLANPEPGPELSPPSWAPSGLVSLSLRHITVCHFCHYLSSV